MSTTEYVQKHSFEVLKKIKSYCNTYNVEYFLVYGSLLGAERHKGFIPWDDDIDIAMDTGNYRRFMENIDKLPDGLTYYFADSVLRIFDESCNQVQMSFGSKRKGVFVDIFPFFRVEEKRKKLVEKYLLLEKCWEYRRKIREKSKFLYILYKLILFPMRLVDKKFLRPIFLERWKTWLDEDVGEYIAWNYLDKTICIYRVKDIYPLKKKLFQDELFSVPNNVHAVLVDTYGEGYMTPVKWSQHFN